MAGGSLAEGRRRRAREGSKVSVCVGGGERKEEGGGRGEEGGRGEKRTGTGTPPLAFGTLGLTRQSSCLGYPPAERLEG